MGEPYKFKGDVRRQIAEAYGTDEPLRSIAQRFGCDVRTIRRIVAERDAPLKRTRSKRQQIIHISQTEPHTGPTEIARRLKTSFKYVIQVRVACGFRMSKTPNVDPAKDRADMRAVQEVRP